MNQLIRDWTGVKGWIPADPHTPIGLVGAMLRWHGRERLADRPAALDMAREAEELAAARARVAAQRVERVAAQDARAVGRAAVGGAGHTAARAAAAAAAHRAVLRRTASAAADAAYLDAAVRAARETKQG